MFLYQTCQLRVCFACNARDDTLCPTQASLAYVRDTLFLEYLFYAHNLIPKSFIVFTHSDLKTNVRCDGIKHYGDDTYTLKVHKQRTTTNSLHNKARSVHWNNSFYILQSGMPQIKDYDIKRKQRLRDVGQSLLFKSGRCKHS